MSDSRDYENIWIHRVTYDCALNGCIACLYKICPQGSLILNNNTINLPPNIRPELCPRSKLNELYHGLYHSYHKILTVGDGDFSFSLAIGRHLGKNGENLVATSHESFESVIRTYPPSQNIINELKSLSIHVLHDIDATKLSSYCSDGNSRLEYTIFDRIIWNFPCVRVPDGLDGQVSELEQNIMLLRQFFREAKLFMNETSEIHISHKTIEPFCWWNIIQLGRNEGLHFAGCVIFDRYLYPGYINRKVLDKKSFPLHDALVYIFTIDNNQSNNTLNESTMVSLNDFENFQRIFDTLKNFKVPVSQKKELKRKSGHQRQKHDKNQKIV